MGMTRRGFLKGGLAAAAFLGGGSTAWAADALDRHDLEIRTVRLSLGLTTPLRAVHLSDIHFDPLYETGYLRRVFEKTALCEPDIVFLTGDYVSHTTARIGEFARIAGEFRPHLGMWASLGNHDVWHGANQIRTALEGQGIRVLRNALAPLPCNPGWTLAGFDSFWAGRPDPALFSLAPAHTKFLTLAHEPDSWDTLADPRNRLQLSGHTHGGQVRAPLFGPLQLPRLGRRYDEGLFQRDGRSLSVNRGIGTVNIPARINCRPEITVLELV